MLDEHVKDADKVTAYAASRMETMGERIKRLREASNLTQPELGEAVGVSRSAVAQWEDGSTENIKLQIFLRLCEVLNTDPHYLVWGPERVDPLSRQGTKVRRIRSQI